MGFDEYGFAYRSKTGDKVHAAECLPYGEPYGPGDVIGMLIHLPSSTRRDVHAL